ncbi:MAG: LysR family transcriptional regulator [Eubacteriales bacterium]|nr:LysR family transcriptional regulator [Eubacteriales bacterium]
MIPESRAAGAILLSGKEYAVTLEQIQYFHAAAQFGSFSKAAEAIHISQPSLSIAVQKLEKELGVELFAAKRRGAVLTDAGRLFLQDTQNVLRHLDLAVTHMRQFSEKNRAEIRIAYTASLADAYIPRLLKSFLARERQGCCIYSDEMPSSQIAQGIREGRFDLGLCSALAPDPELEMIPVMYQPLCLLLPMSENVDAYTSAQALERTDLICYRKDYPMYRQLAGLFEKWQVSPHVIHYAYSEDAIAHLVEQELGTAIVAKTEGLERYRVRILFPGWLKEGRYIYLIHHRTRLMSSAAQMLKEQILADCAQRDSLKLEPQTTAEL